MNKQEGTIQHEIRSNMLSPIFVIFVQVISGSNPGAGSQDWLSHVVPIDPMGWGARSTSVDGHLHNRRRIGSVGLNSLRAIASAEF